MPAFDVPSCTKILNMAIRVLVLHIDTVACNIELWVHAT